MNTARPGPFHGHDGAFSRHAANLGGAVDLDQPPPPDRAASPNPKHA